MEQLGKKRVCKMRAEWSELGDCDCGGPGECKEPLSEVERQEMMSKVLRRVIEIVDEADKRWD